MSILVDKNTRLVVQGITGHEGGFHARRMKAYGTNVVAGVVPGKEGQEVHGIPVYDTMESAVEETGANASVIFVPARFAVDAIYEATDSGVELVVCITEGVPVWDMIYVCRRLRDVDVRLIGSNCPGVITPGEAMVGILPGDIFIRGEVGIVSRSGTLTYQIVDDLSRRGIGQSTCVGLGGDPIVGTRFIDVLRMFEEDSQTKAVVLIGEIGGTDEEEAARFIKEDMSKPVVAYITGQTAPPGKRMGHAGAIVSGNMGTAESKIKALEAAGVPVAAAPYRVEELVEDFL